MATSVSLQRASHPDQPAIPVTDGLALGRNLLGGGPHDFAYVSRKQAECTLLDGQLLIVSCGSNPTGVKPQGASGWSWLAKGQQRVLSEGDRIALDKKKLADDSSTVLVVRAPLHPASAAPTGPPPTAAGTRKHPREEMAASAEEVDAAKRTRLAPSAASADPTRASSPRAPRS